MARSCARRSMATETNFIARVICWVFFTERMRRRKSRSVGIVLRRAALLIPCRGYGSRKALLERIQSSLDFGFNAVVQGFLRGDVLQHGRIIRFDELQKLAFKPAYLRDRNPVSATAGGHVNDQHLLLRGQRGVLFLLQ